MSLPSTELPPNELPPNERTPDELAPMQLARLAGRDGLGPRGSSLGALHGVTMLLRPGVHGIVGRVDDGTLALCALACGRREPSEGAVLLLGRSPSRHARLRARIGALLAQPEPLIGPTVQAALGRLDAFHGTDFGSVVAELGGSACLERRSDSLSFDEARLVDLALAVGRRQSALCVLYEPFENMASLDRPALRRRLIRLAADGAVIIVATSHLHDVQAFADHIHGLYRGRLSGSSPTSLWPNGPSHELVIWLSDGDDAPRLACALSCCEHLVGVSWRRSDNAAACVTVQMRDSEHAALEVADVVAVENVSVTALYSDCAPPRDLFGPVRSNGGWP